MKSRRDEILAKKAKLAELKRQNELRQQESSILGRSVASSDAGPARNLTNDRTELDSLISSLVGDGKGSGSSATSPPGSPTSLSLRTRSGQVVRGSNQKTDSAGTDASSVQPRKQDASTTSQTLSFAPLRTIYEIRSHPPKPEYVTYNRGVQTAEPWSHSRTSSSSGSDGELNAIGDRQQSKRLSRRQRKRDEELRQNIRDEIMEESSAVQVQIPSEESAEVNAVKQKEYSPWALTDEERNALTSSDEFLEFVERSSKVIERALDEDYDVLADYSLGTFAALDDEEDDSGSKGRKGRRIRELMQFYDERWSRKRMISDIGISPKFPELVLASFTKNPSAPYDPSGILQVWNTHMRDRPEYIFHANSDILTAQFSPYHPHLILGATYSGQVLLWDTRSRSHAPAQETPLTGYGHTHPVYSLNVVGTQNAHNIVTTSTDGVMCTWSVGMLVQPQEYLQLAALPAPVPNSNMLAAARPDPIGPTCTAFPASDPTYFLAGTQQGTIHLCHRHDRAGARAGVDSHIAYRSHAAPVMSLDYHRASGPVDLGDLVLSSGMDWSVKLWRVRAPAAIAPSTTGVATSPAPLLDISKDDVVYDAKWSPTKPGVFACVDGAGSLEVYDLTVDLEVPVAKATPSVRMDAGIPVPARSLNKCAWEVREGKRIATGGLDGVITLFEVGSELGGAGSAKAEEWKSVKKMVARLEGV